MLVKDRMTKDPVTVRPETPVLEALNLLRNKRFRRLPVLEGEHLVGIVTDKDLKDAMPSKATTLSVWELNYLLAKLMVKDVMARPVITVQAAEPLEQAALLLQAHKIGGLPVLEGPKLVGIVTVTDVLKAFTEMLGLEAGGVRITLDLPDKPGALAHAAAAVPPSNIVSVATVDHQGGVQRVVLRTVGEGVEGVEARLRAAGHEVVDVRKLEPRALA